jgi:hypothetical protein
MRFEKDVLEASLARLKDEKEKYAALTENLVAQIGELPLSVNIVAQEAGLIQKAQTNRYWATMTDQSFDHLATQLAPLMHFRDGRDAGTGPAKFNFADVLTSKEYVEFGPEHESLSIAQYRQLVEQKVNELTASNPILQKIRDAQPVSDKEAETLASQLHDEQFRTPRHIIKLISELVNPQLGHRICDPACGTAGFLLDAYQYIITQLAKQKAKKDKTFTPDDDGFVRSSISGLLTQDSKDILEQSLYGYDFDATMVRLALMNLMMHGIDNPHVDYQDTLSKGFTEEGEYDIIMANPPFTGSIDKGDINESLKLNTTKTELLFTERIFTLLKTGGTAGIIIPQGVLFGSSGVFVEVRKKLVEEAELKAVISLPSGVFKPYAGVATAILVFTRGGKTEHTWFYKLENDGLSLDDKRQRIKLDTGPGDSIPWSEDYFKYRTLSQLLRPPFSFREIWDEVYYDIEEASYETVKAKVFEYVEQGILEQKFDETRKEIVFYPRA